MIHVLAAFFARRRVAEEYARQHNADPVPGYHAGKRIKQVHVLRADGLRREGAKKPVYKDGRRVNR